MTNAADDQPPLQLLVDNHQAFLKFLTRRVGDRAVAEDILQDAFVKVMSRPDQAPHDEGIVPWFYRNLRNASIDRFRRTATATKALEAFAHELQTETPSEAIYSEICACVSEVARTLKPEYADALATVEVNSESVRGGTGADGDQCRSPCAPGARGAAKACDSSVRYVRRAWLR